MKKLFTILALFMCITASAQQFEAPAKKAKTAFTDTTTTFTYKTNKGEVCKVYKSSRGSYYYYSAKNKSNTLRKYYVPKEVQIKMGRKYDDKK